MLSRFSTCRRAISKLISQVTRAVSCNASPVFDKHQRNDVRQTSASRWALAGVIAAAGLSLYLKFHEAENHAAQPHVEAGSLKEGLPTYTAADVAKHKTKASRIWVTYKNGVYDITDYVIQHPGGSKILLGAGGAIDDFFDHWGLTMSNREPFRYEDRYWFRCEYLFTNTHHTRLWLLNALLFI